MHVWSQLTSLVLAFLGFILAMLPRTQKRASSNEDKSPVRSWPLSPVIHSSVFWAGVIFLLYAAVQGLNPAWHYFSNAESWWLEPATPVSWLPSSVEAPFAKSNPWRALTIFVSFTLLLSSIWAGFSRRKSYHLLWVAVMANATVLALLGIAQRLLGADRIFGLYKPSNRAFVSSFIYPNHAGCYFNLMLGLAAGMAWWHHQRSNRCIEGPGAAAAATSVAICCSSLVLISCSRVSIVLMMVFTVIVGGALLFRLVRRNGPIGRRQESIPLIMTLTAFLCVGFVVLSSDKLRERFAIVASSPVAADQDRSFARQAARDMFADHWMFGWGAGSFRYGFTKYVKFYPAIYYSDNGGRRTWEHAHSDPLEFLCEFGVLGLLPLVYILIQVAWKIARSRVWRNPLTIPIVCAVALVIFHSWFDFVFQCPAVLLTWGVMLVGAIRWAKLDRPKESRTTVNAG